MGQSGKLRWDLDEPFRSDCLVIHLVVIVFMCLAQVGRYRGNLNPSPGNLEHGFEDLHVCFCVRAEWRPGWRSSADVKRKSGNRVSVIF